MDRFNYYFLFNAMDEGSKATLRIINILIDNLHNIPIISKRVLKYSKTHFFTKINLFID